MSDVDDKSLKAMRLMVAIDDSQCSRYALEWAIENVVTVAFICEPVLLLNAQSLPVLPCLPSASFVASSHSMAAVAAAPELIQSMQDHQKKISLAILEQAKKICAQKGVSVEIISEIEDPKDAICEAVEKYKVDLLIMGSHGRGALQRVFLGSVSNYCANHAKCPVLVVKKPA